MTVLYYLTRYPLAFWTIVSSVCLAGTAGYIFSRMAESYSVQEKAAPAKGAFSGDLERALKVAGEVINKRGNTQEILLSLKAEGKKTIQVPPPSAAIQSKPTPPQTLQPLPSLEGVMVVKTAEGGLKRYAILNGRRFEKGMAPGGFRLAEIRDFSVLLETPQGLKELSVTRYPLPKGITDDFGKSPEEIKE